MTQLQIIDDKKQITGKKSIITACNVDYRLKRSGPKVDALKKQKYFFLIFFFRIFVCFLGFVIKLNNFFLI